MKAMLIWSDGTNISTHIFEDKDGKTGYELAVEHMHKEYDDHNWRDSAKEEFGAFRGDSSCCYSAEIRFLSVSLKTMHNAYFLRESFAFVIFTRSR